MPYEISWEPSGVAFHFTGVVSDEDMIASNGQVYASPCFGAMEYQIVDFSMIEKFEVSSATIWTVAESDRKAARTLPDVKVAIITSAPFMRGMSNMYSLAHSGRGGSWTTQIFEREEDARSWALASR